MSTPVFIVPLSDQHATEGDTISIDCVIQGKPLPELSWLEELCHVATIT